jgi:hypothetical protein
MHRMSFTMALAALATFTMVCWYTAHVKSVSHPWSQLTSFKLLSQVVSTSLPRRDPMDNIQPLTWRGEVDGHAYELTGTAEQVWNQLKERHPDIQLKKRDLSTRAPLNKVSRIISDLGVPC